MQWTETANRLGIKFCEYGRYSILIVEKCCSNVLKTIALVSSAFFFFHRVDWLVWSLNIAWHSVQHNYIVEGLHYLFINKCWTCHRPYNHDVGRECFCYLSNTRKSVSSDIQTLRSRLKKRGAASVLHCFSKHILREKKGKSSPNFMIITLVESDTIFLLCKCYFRELLKWYLKHIHI